MFQREGQQMNTKQTIGFISKYLVVLGILQIMSLNVCGFCSLFWAKGIKKKKPSSRNWVFVIHGLYLLVAISFVVWGVISPSFFSTLTVSGHPVKIPPWVGFSFIMFFVIAHLIPVILLARNDVSKEFAN